MYSRRFKFGPSRYMTRALIEDGYIIIKQTERIDHPKVDNRSVVVLSVDDFKRMTKALGLNDISVLIKEG